MGIDGDPTAEINLTIINPPETSSTSQKPPEEKPPKASVGEAEKTIIKKIEEGGNPDQVLKYIAAEAEENSLKPKDRQKEDKQEQSGTSNDESPEKRLPLAMQEREDNYLARFPEARREELKQRYEDERSHRDAVQSEITEFARKREVDLNAIPDKLDQLSFEADTGNLTEQAIRRIIDQFFLSENASYNPEKHALVLAQTKEYIKLLRQAQTEGAIPKDVKAAEIYRLVLENIAALAWQDRAASENLLGDHGVRHIVGHNINASMQIAEALKSRGASITAMDKLLMHQIMIYHDIGYAMAPVRDSINKEGIHGQDAGHNLLGAQYARERIQDPFDLWQKVFGQNQENLDILHRGILYHDKDEEGGAGIKFVTELKEGQNASQVRVCNIESIIRTADNTHAFEDKLPELLYAFPETIKYMRLMKTAGEIGDTETFLQLRRELVGKIRGNEQLSPDDREALSLTIMGQGNEDGSDPKRGLQPESYNFSVGRICGNEPEFYITDDGRILIVVRESAIHQEVVGLFGKESLDQLRKFLADLQGISKEDVNLDTPEIVAGSLIIRLQTGEQRATALTDYQQRIEEMLRDDPAFVEFANNDTILSLEQLSLEKSYQLFSEGEIDLAQLRELTASFINAVEPDADIVKLVQERIATIKVQRKLLLGRYRNPAL